MVFNIIIYYLLLLQEGFTNLCQKYGLIKNVTIHKKEKENRAFIEFEDKKLVITFSN